MEGTALLDAPHFPRDGSHYFPSLRGGKECATAGIQTPRRTPSSHRNICRRIRLGSSRCEMQSSLLFTGGSLGRDDEWLPGASERSSRRIGLP